MRLCNECIANSSIYNICIYIHETGKILIFFCTGSPASSFFFDPVKHSDFKNTRNGEHLLGELVLPKCTQFFSVFFVCLFTIEFSFF